ncbi:hypothetical protein [Streptomyces sp. NPDC058371]|uniref:hypothetical protein n=1 Tax=Streptomyces sp. NPDC058371 TaxID=3346463 RepID=UPI0036539D8F
MDSWERARRILDAAGPASGLAGLSHERGLLLSEAEFYRAAATAGVPAPGVVSTAADHHASPFTAVTSA